MAETSFTRALMSALLVLGLFATRAEAGVTSLHLLEGDFIWQPSDNLDHEACTMVVDGGTFAAQINLDSLSDSLQEVSLNFDARQPTNITRGIDKIALKQSQWVFVQVDVGGSEVLGAAIEKCSLSVSFGAAKAKGVSTLSCRGDDLSQLLGPTDIASVKSAMLFLRHVSFKVDSAQKKWSLTVGCAGSFVP